MCIWGVGKSIVDATGQSFWMVANDMCVIMHVRPSVLHVGFIYCTHNSPLYVTMAIHVMLTCMYFAVLDKIVIL